MHISASTQKSEPRQGAFVLLAFMLFVAGGAPLSAATFAGEQRITPASEQRTLLAGGSSAPLADGQSHPPVGGSADDPADGPAGNPADGPGAPSADVHDTALPDSLQPPLSSPNIADTIWTDTKESVTDALLFFSAPARFSLREWGITAWTLLGTGMTAFADNGLRRTFAHKEGKVLNVMVDVGNFYGTWVPGVTVSSGLYLGGLVFDEPKIRRAGRHVFQSILYAAAITNLTKVLVGRHRPHLEDGPYTLEGPSFKDEYNSFPSGHATMAFSVSSALAAEIGDPWVSAGLYTLAGMTAISRMYSDRHWGSDVVFGAVVGTICGLGVVHLHDPEGDKAGLLIVPSLHGITAVWRF